MTSALLTSVALQVTKTRGEDVCCPRTDARTEYCRLECRPARAASGRYD